ncbi:delta-60 repeat domain-containing protein [Nocardiopsis sp. LOL_012]|uniref:delta-60 repeat domain-containing protein n=1 Tax=Nocardiopsis sp. LOL_012 TaxID=3345409 RepID=UPI003A8A633D
MEHTRPLAALASLGVTLALTAAPAAATPPSDTPLHGVVSERPAPWTPHVMDGRVKDIARVGDTVVVAGDFTRVAEADRDDTYDVHNVFAFEHGTGRILEDFVPEVSGTVRSLAEGPGGSVVVGGSFLRVNGEEHRGLALLSLDDGETVPGFDAALENGSVHRVAEHGGLLYVGGTFTGIDGWERVGLARLDTRTGQVDPGFAPRISAPRRGTLRVQDLALSPGGTRLLINGPFTEVDGRKRHQIAMIDTFDGALSPWSTTAYRPNCDYDRMHTYMREMAFSPDGSFFTVVTAGGPEIKPGLCKSAARFETVDRPGAHPTWVNKTGGDAVYAVEATFSAVYVGGHQRWMDNESGDHAAGPGAVERKGIAALDPATGRALPWNPGRTRGHGVEALLVTDEGLYVGSDTEDLGGEYHARIGLFPPA